MDVQKLKAEHPEVAEALIAEGRQAGAAAECQRIKDVEALSMPGHEALIASLKFDGKTSGPEAAVKVLQAENAKRESRVAALRADAGDATVRHAAAPEPGDDDKEDGEDDDDMDADDDSASASPTGGKSPKKAKLANVADAGRVDAQARAYQAEQAKLGNKVSAAQAVAHVSKGGR